MKLFVSLLALGVLAAASFGLYQLSYEVQRQEQELADLHDELARERQAILVLQAEWSWKTRPQRLQDLAERHLGLGPLTSAQIVTPDALPARPAPAPEVAP